MKLKNKICNEKSREAAKKNMENRTYQNDGNKKTACISLTFVNFASTID